MVAAKAVVLCCVVLRSLYSLASEFWGDSSCSDGEAIDHSNKCVPFLG